MVCIGLLLMTISFIKESPALEIEADMYDFAPLTVTYDYNITKPKAELIVSEFDKNDFKFEFVEGGIESWDNYTFEKKTKETLGAYYLTDTDNYNNYIYEYIVAINSVAYEA